MAKIYYDEDCNLDLVKDKCVAVLGYGNQGRSQALNMRDMGIKRVIVGSIKDESHDKAVEDGFEVMSIEEATAQADVLFILLPDEVCPEIFENQMKPNFKKNRQGFSVIQLPRGIAPFLSIDMNKCLQTCVWYDILYV